MAIIATPGSAVADSYVSLDEAFAYFENKRINIADYLEASDNTGGTHEQLLRQATLVLDQFDYVGDEVSAIQSLKWPRTLGGVTQVETATVLGTVTGNGNATVIVTSADLTNSPLSVSVAVLNLDTASDVAGKIRTALPANTEIAEQFIVSGSGADVVLTNRESGQDDTLNISIDNGTCTGLTPALVSTETVEGESGDLIRNYPTNVIPPPIQHAQCEIALWLASTGGTSAAAAGAISELQIGNSVKAKFGSSEGSISSSLGMDYSGLPLEAARFLKGLRLHSVLA